MINLEKYPELTVLSLQEVVEMTQSEDFDPDEQGFMFGIKFQSEDWTLDEFLERQNLFKFDDPVQRGTDAWSSRKRSEGIASILMRIELGPIKVQKISHNKKLYRNVIDGGNRLASQRAYIKNEWALDPETYIFGELNGEKILIDVSGAYFNDLPKMFQRRITGYSFQVHLYSMDDEMKNEMFYRWNNYEPHTSSELKRAHMSAIMQETVNNALKMNFTKIGFKDWRVNRSQHMEPLLQGFALIETNNQTSLKEDVINDMLIKNKFSPKTLLLVSKITPFLEEVCLTFEETKLAKKIFHKKHKPTLLYVASQAPKDLPVEVFAAWANKFFIEDIAESGYNNFGGDTRESNVQKRNEIALNHFKEYILLQTEA
ncbi:hypothetical protein EHV15_35980 [Paenibacillus oralis]|uniref:DUF262 domain-containing protein n=1 Tax=Paenibacillus oralis TaxID=2490856 RepID=A0A3P3TA94_9BACL|nr:hypothetical protein [Paenibacillus oralis]RRJ54971.1 hypothetical protein EHV15_35980 [Paenibacillus oralis]